MSNPIQPLVLRAPGIGGLNFEGEEVRSNPAFARIAENCVYDEGGRLCARKGYNQLTTGGNELSGTPDIGQLHMLDTSSGNKLLLTADVSGNKIYEVAPSYSAAPTDVTGTASTSGTTYWQFQNFNDKVVAAQSGNTMIVKSYAGNFAPISASSGTVPDGDCVHSAFGRLWAQKGDTGTGLNIIAYCALLDETDWGGAGSGEINVLGTAGAVATGYDELVAISSFDTYLVAFLRNSIVIYSNAGSPGTLAIEKVIQGVGCIARDSVQQTGDDIIFLSATGLRSLRSTIQSEGNLEFADMSKNVRRELVQLARQVTSDTIKSAWFPEDALYLIRTNTTIWAFDLKDRTAATGSDNQPRITQFPDTGWTAMYGWEGDLYLGSAGTVGEYANYQDAGSSYEMKWQSVWADFDAPVLKMLKKIICVLEAAGQQSVTFLWEMDYGESAGSSTKTTTGETAVAEWGLAEWGLAEWSGQTPLTRLNVHGSRTGETISFGLTTTINGDNVCIEQMTVYVAPGRRAR